MKSLKNTLSILLSLMLVFGSVAAGGISVSADGNVYEISSYSDLMAFASLVNSGNTAACAKLMNDIECKNSDGTAATDWTPIGNYTNKYIGTFDGDGRVIIGLSNSEVTDMPQYAGLFGYVGSKTEGGVTTKGTVKNVGHVGGSITGQNYAGGVVGYNNGGSITNCYNTGDVTATGMYTYVGGVVGYNEQGTVKNCYNTGSVSDSGNFDVGGVVGRNAGGSVTNCYNTGSVSGNSGVGGVAGYSDGGSVTNCYNTGVVSGINKVGGVVGEIRGTVENCYNTGAVSGNSCVGGVAGYNIHSGSVTNCYNAGNVFGTDTVGGVAGLTDSEYKVTNCYYDKTICENIGAINGADIDTEDNKVKGLTTTEMTGVASNDDNTMKALFDAEDDNGEKVWLDPKADSEDDGVNYWFYPHLKGFAYDSTELVADWPAKLVIYISWDNDGPFTYYGSHHKPEPKGVVVSTLDRIPDELAECEVRYYRYPNDAGEPIDPPAEPGNYRVGYWLGDEEVLYRNFSIFETGDCSVDYQYREPDNEQWTGIEDCVDVGEYRAVLTFRKYGDKTALKDFVITPKSLTGAIVTLSQDTAEYTGGGIMPEVTEVKVGEKVLNKNADYIVSYEDNINASENAKVTVTGKGNYKDSVKKMFTISPAGVTLTANSRNTDIYDGTEKTVTGFTSSVEGLTFEGVTASGSGTQADSYDVTFSGVTIGETKDSSGNYVVTATENGTLTINPAAPGTSAAAEDIDYGQTAVVTFTVPADAKGKVTFTLDESESGVTKDIENGQAVCEFENLTIGSHKVECVYTGDSNYESGDAAIANFEVRSIDCALTINYVYAKGGEAYETYTDNVAIFTQYSVTSPEIEGYTPDIAKVEGTMGDDDIGGKTVTVTYTANTYTATLLVDGEEYKKIPFTYGQKSIQLPDVPEKEGHTGEWEGYSLGAGDITINAIYKLVEYTVTYIFDGEVLSEMSIPYGEAVSSPRIPSKDYYEFTGWDAEIPETMPANNLTFTAVLKPIEYTATFVDENGETIKEVKFTVETEKLEEPEVPAKEGYEGAWEEYEIGAGDITVKPVYTPGNICKLDNEYHGDTFFGKMITFFHNHIWYVFRLLGFDIFVSVKFDW